MSEWGYFQNGSSLSKTALHTTLEGGMAGESSEASAELGGAELTCTGQHPAPVPEKALAFSNPMPSYPPSQLEKASLDGKEKRPPFYHLPLDFCGKARDEKLRIKYLSSHPGRMWQGGQSTAPVFTKACIGQWVYVPCTQCFLQNNNCNNCSTLWEKGSVFSLVEDQCMRN